MKLVGGGVEGDIDLGGVPLTMLGITVGGADLDVDFSTPLTKKLESLNIDGGGITISVSNIGNTNFDKLLAIPPSSLLFIYCSLQLIINYAMQYS